MKKIIFLLLFSIGTSLAISSCTEPDIKPSNSLTKSGNGGGPSDPQ